MSRKRILIVEAVRSLAMSWSDRLEHAGYVSFVATSARAAVDVLRSASEIHAILLGLQLSDSDARQLLRSEQFLQRRLPVVVATDDVQFACAIEAMRSNYLDLLVKPVTEEDLISKLGAAIIAGEVLEAGQAGSGIAYPIAQGDPARRMVCLSDPDERKGLPQALRGLTLDQIERIAVEGAIEREGGSLPAAARALGVSPSTLYRKRERWSLKEEQS